MHDRKILCELWQEKRKARLAVDETAHDRGYYIFVSAILYFFQRHKV